MPPSDTAQPKPFSGDPQEWRIILALALAGFTCFSLLYAPQPLLPQFTTYFGITPSMASLGVSAGTGAMALCLIPLSLLADRYGRERLMKIGLSGAALFALLSAMTDSFFVLLVCRAALGLCIAGVPAAAMAYLGEELPPHARARAMGLYIGANALGGMVGRFTTGWIAEYFDWHGGLAINGLIGVVAVVVCWRLLPHARRFSPRSLSPSELWRDVRRIYADRALPWLFMTAFLLMGTFVGLYNFLGFRLSGAPYQLGPSAIGTVYLLYAVGSYSSAWAGRQTERVGRPRMAWLMSLCMGLGLLLTQVTYLPVVIGGVAVFTFGFFAAHSVASAWVGSRAGERRGLVSALYLSSYYLGGSVLGSAAGWPWTHGGWLMLSAGLACCIAALVLIAWALRHADR